MPLYDIVGMRFRPPATGLVNGISTGQTLYLRAEPTNPYDENAVQVILKSEEIDKESYENLNQELSGFGKDISDILATSEWHLGYIRKEVAKVLRDTQIVTPDQDIRGEFNLNFSGKPMVSI